MSNAFPITGAVPTFWQFSGNSPWDPDYYSTGTAANMWANLSTWYNKYMCTYSKFWIKITVITIGDRQVQAWNQPRSLTQAQASDIRTILAQPYGKFRQLQGTTVSKTGSIVFKGKMATVKILGRKLDPSIDRVATNADPNEEYIWDTVVLCSTACSVNVECRMQYWVEFSDRAAVSYL